MLAAIPSPGENSIDLGPFAVLAVRARNAPPVDREPVQAATGSGPVSWDPEESA